MKIGIQLFGVLKDRQEKPAEALEMLRELSYSRIEPCISLQPIPGLDHVVWSLDWLDAHGEEIRRTGLEMVSCHLFAENPGAERLRDRRTQRLDMRYYTFLKEADGQAPGRPHL